MTSYLYDGMKVLYHTIGLLHSSKYTQIQLMHKIDSLGSEDLHSAEIMLNCHSKQIQQHDNHTKLVEKYGFHDNIQISRKRLHSSGPIAQAC